MRKNLHLTRQAERALKTTFLEAKLFQSKSINTVHLLLCVLRNENDPTTKLLNKLRVNYDNVKEQFKSMITEDNLTYGDSPSAETFSSSEKDDTQEKHIPKKLQIKRIKNQKLQFWIILVAI